MNKREIVEAAKNVKFVELPWWIGIQKSEGESCLNYDTMASTMNRCRERIKEYEEDLPKACIGVFPFIGIVQIMVVVDAESAEVF